jgi:alkanesulfonate monooxygenase SsuD/methylene tetrahydromethanopterin reductase-like flavin-dependent oxidoreductase (luciferase family)
VRIGLVLGTAGTPSPLESLTRQLVAAEEHGLDLAMIPSSLDATDALGSALIVTAALAPRSTVLRLAAEAVAGTHPVTLAEEAAVADQISGGRLVLVVRGDDDPELLGEVTDVLLAATAPRPFVHEGLRWRIPGQLADNAEHETRLIVTPPTAQLELPIWLSGAAAPVVARARTLSHIVESRTTAPADEWHRTESALGLSAHRLRRPAIVDVRASTSGDFDPEALVAALLGARQEWGIDVALLRPPPALDDLARVDMVRRVAMLVGPRVQLEATPARLLSHWQTTLEDRSDARCMQ